MVVVVVVEPPGPQARHVFSVTFRIDCRIEEEEGKIVNSPRDYSPFPCGLGSRTAR